jgi:hypothetical protein
MNYLSFDEVYSAHERNKLVKTSLKAYNQQKTVFSQKIFKLFKENLANSTKLSLKFNVSKALT